MSVQPSRLTQTLPLLPIGDSTIEGAGRVIALANNENVESPSPAVLKACSEACASANWYPDISYRALRQTIAQHYASVSAERILVGAGAGELIALTAQAFCNPGDEVIIGEYGYLYFSIAAKAVGARPVYASVSPSANEPRLGIEQILEHVNERTRIVYLDNPSNPLGNFVTKADLTRLRDALPSHVLLVLDGAYSEYATAQAFDAGDFLVTANDNTVVLRTFSKIYGLAGLRVGWAHGSEELIANMQRVQRPGNISGVAQAAAITALGERALFEERLHRNTETRKWFTDFLRNQLGLNVIDSQTNFVLVTLVDSERGSADELVAHLKADGILVRPMGPYQLPNSIRITVGTPTQMGEVAMSISKFF